MRPSDHSQVAYAAIARAAATPIQARTGRCSVCRRELTNEELVPAEIIHPRLARLIKRQHPEWNDTGHVCLADLNRLCMECGTGDGDDKAAATLSS